MPRQGRVRVVASAAMVAQIVATMVAKPAIWIEVQAASWISALAKAFSYHSSEKPAHCETERVALKD